MKLISMTDFVLEQVQNSKYEEFNKVNETFVNNVINYAKFLKQLLELWMFIPCDKYGNVLEEPDADFYMMVTDEEIVKYQQAKERCLFEFNYYFLSFDNLINNYYKNTIFQLLIYFQKLLETIVLTDNQHALYALFFLIQVFALL